MAFNTSEFRRVIEASDQPTVYRFAGNERTYGPRALHWVVRTYGDNGSVSAAPERDAANSALWRPVAAWAAELPTACPSAEQRARLRKLGLVAGEAITFAQAADAINAEEAARRVARGLRPPTTLKLRRLAEIGISPPRGATRAEVDWLITQHAISQRTRKLAAAGMILPAEGVSNVNIDDLEDALETLHTGLELAAEQGLEFRPPYPLDADTMREWGDLLEEFWSLAGDLDDSWSHLAESGDFARVPTAAQRLAVLPLLLEALQSARWRNDDSSYLSLGIKALAMSTEPKAN